MKNKNLSNKKNESLNYILINEFCTKSHENLRKCFDEVYAKTGIPSKQRIKKNSDGTEGDINVPFENLHPDWQKENIAAAHAALTALRMNGTVEEKASFIHEEWMKRNPKADWNAEQHIPYEQLPEVEKEKDRRHLKIMIDIVKNKNTIIQDRFYILE